MSADFIKETIPTVMELITRVGETLQSSRPINAILDDINEIVTGVMNADACSIYLYEDNALSLKSTKGISFSKDTARIEIGEGVIGRAALQQSPVSIRDLRDQSDEAQAPLSVPRDFRSLLCVPMVDGDNLVGVMNVWKREPYAHVEMEMNFVAFIATQLVGSIRNTQLYEEVIRGFRDIATLHQVGHVITSVLDLDELLPVIAQTCSDHLSARGCALRLINAKNGLLEIRGHYGLTPDQIKNSALRPGEGIPGEVAATGVPIIRNAPEECTEPYTGDLDNLKCSLVCVPLVLKNKVIGTLGVFEKTPRYGDESTLFEEEDVALINMIGVQVAMAIENARLYKEATRFGKEKDMRVEELSLLLEITNIMRGSTDLEELLYVILTSVTMGEGLGFNRALLFLADEKENFLSGKMAVGPLTPEAAAKHWEAVPPNHDGLPLAEVVKKYGQFNMTAGFKIDRMIKKVVIPIHREKGVLARTFLERSIFNVSDYVPPPQSEEIILSGMSFSTFAAVPLMARDHVIGVIVVDNLITREPIADDQMQFLQLFANQAAIAIEMGRVYKNLELTNKSLIDARDLLVRTKTMATLGEFSAGVAHELRNPLVAIGGFAKRLVKMLGDNERAARYAGIISREVEGLEDILNQILDFVGGSKTVFVKVDVINLLERVFRLFSETLNVHNVRIITDYDPRVQYIYVDETQMRQVFTNLIKNAIETIAEKKEPGTITVTTTIIDSGKGGFGFEVADTGGGIDPDDVNRIFDPFFTKKASGTGLGLPTCSRIVETNHGGRIFVDSKIGRGTNVLLWFPIEMLHVEDDADTAPSERDEQQLAPDA